MWLYALGLVAVFILVVVAWILFVSTETVHDYQKGLLYTEGRFVRELGPGRYRYLDDKARIEVYDMRSQMLIAPGQSILTKDNAGVKITLSGRYEIVDALTAAHSSANYVAQMYDLCQIALRDLVSVRTLDELLENKTEIDSQLVAAVAEKARRLGVNVTALAIKDVILPANLKKAYSGVLEARKDAQRQLEIARGEQAVLRSLANAAKLYQGDPALLQARLVQSLAGGGNQIVFAADGKVSTASSAK